MPDLDRAQQRLHAPTTEELIVTVCRKGDDLGFDIQHVSGRVLGKLVFAKLYTQELGNTTLGDHHFVPERKRS